MSKSLSLLQDFLYAWEGTPYLAGQCERGFGVDCLRFVDAALQNQTEQKLDPLPRECQDAAFHNAEVVLRVGRIMVQRFDLETVRKKPPFQPCDVLCVRTKTRVRTLTVEEKAQKSPHHVFIVGPCGLRCWHACRTASQAGSKVCWTGVGAVLAGYDIMQVWRSKKL